jgi:hypothetical protein
MRTPLLGLSPLFCWERLRGDAPKIQFSYRGNKTVAAVVTAMALIVVAPTGAMAGTAARSASAAQQISSRTSTMTDISAAHRRHCARRGNAAARAAYGSIIGGPVYGYSSSGDGGYPGFGNGVGDNSRNRTW